MIWWYREEVCQGKPPTRPTTLVVMLSDAEHFVKEEASLDQGSITSYKSVFCGLHDSA